MKQRLKQMVLCELDANWNWVTAAAVFHMVLILIGTAITGQLDWFVIEAFWITMTVRSWWRGRSHPHHIIGRQQTWAWHDAICETCKQQIKILEKEQRHEQKEP